jgi:hypothetical protein
MSLSTAFQRFERESHDVVYPEVRTAVKIVKTRDARFTPEQSAEHMSALGFGVLNTLNYGLATTIPILHSPEQGEGFSGATRLYMGTMAEIATGTRERNRDLAAELIKLSQQDNLQAVIDEAITSTARGQIKEEIPGQRIVDAAQRFPFLLMLSSEIDLHHLGTVSSPDERDGFQQGLFSSISALDVLATQQAQ